MWSKLEDLVAQANKDNKSIGIFHYSPHERTWWKRFARRFEGKQNVPTLENVESFMNKYFVDLYEYSRKVALPLTGYSIKLLAPYAGFYWSVDNAGGANSLLKYRDATNPSSPDSAKLSAQEWLISYNRDDVRATYSVRSFLRLLKL